MSVPEIHKLIIQVTRPGKTYQYGRVEEGYWLEDDQDFVWLCTESGVKKPDHKRKVPPGADPKTIACLLLKQSVGKKQNDFNRKIIYPQVGY